MPDFPLFPQPPLFVHTFSPYSVMYESATDNNLTLAPATITWPVASTAKYIPFWIPWPYPVRRVFWVNGSTLTTSNADFGIYTTDGTQLYHTGSTALSGATAVQYTSTDFLLSPGRYYFALSIDNTTSRGNGTTGIAVARERMIGLLQEASALPLPATMTPSSVANAALPLCGITRTTTGF